MNLFYGSIRKRIILIVLLAVTPVFIVLLSAEILNRQYAVSQNRMEATGRLRGYVELQNRITDSTRTLLRTVASMPSIRDKQTGPARRILETLLETNPIYTNAILVDLDGNVIAAGKAHEKAMTLNFADRKQFRDAIARNGFAAGEFVVGKQTQKAIFPFGMAVPDVQGEAAGAIIIGVDLDHYNGLFEQNILPAESFFGLCDQNGRRIFRYPMPDRVKLGTPIKREVFEAASTAQSPGSVRAVTSDGISRIIVFEPLTLEGDENPYLYMFIGFNYTMITKKADAIFYRLLFTGTGSLVFALVIAWFLAGRTITDQLEKLRLSMRTFGKAGDVVNSGIDYNDGEVGDLAHSFDKMVATLRRRESERNSALEQLRISEQRLRELIEGVSSISIQGYDEERNVTFWNRASEHLYGYTRDEALGKKLEDLIIPEAMRDTVKELHRRWVKNGEKIPSGELVLEDKAGNAVHVYSSHVLTDAEFGKEMFCIDIDMGPLKQSEQERKQLLDRLRQSQKMEAIGTLAGGIAHDFNNILVPILGYSELLLATLQDESGREGLQHIYTSAIRAKELVRQILTFSRQKSTEFSQVRVNEVLEETIRLLHSALPRNIKIEQSIDSTCPPVWADSTQIHQVIMNIATNAFHAMAEAGGVLTFRLEQRDLGLLEMNKLGMKTGDTVCLSICDTGTGIPPEVLEKIFDPFFTTKEVGKGTGMGLSVVHGIVENMDGAVHVDSTPGEGSEFLVFFPISTDNETDTDAGEDDLSFQAMKGTETILHVDDEKPILQVIQQSLETLGYQVVSMTDPLEALDMFKKMPEKFDLVLTDLSMPGMLGDEFTSQILNIAPHIPVIICTGFSEKLTRESAQELGAHDIIMKPVMLHELTGAIRSAVDG